MNKVKVLLMILGIAMLVSACKAQTAGVATLQDTDTPKTASESQQAEVPVDDEAKMMAFTECMREQGIDMLDPIVDGDGNIQKPEFGNSIDMKREDMADVYDVCAFHLEGVSLGKKDVDRSETIDALVEMATCMRDKGYDIDDPTEATLDTWRIDFKYAVDWDNPDDVADYEECSGQDLPGKK